MNRRYCAAVGTSHRRGLTRVCPELACAGDVWAMRGEKERAHALRR